MVTKKEPQKPQKTARTFSLYHKSTLTGAFFLPAELVKKFFIVF